jgi:hypothetical protein
LTALNPTNDELSGSPLYAFFDPVVLNLNPRQLNVWGNLLH